NRCSASGCRSSPGACRWAYTQTLVSTKTLAACIAFFPGGKDDAVDLGDAEADGLLVGAFVIRVGNSLGHDLDGAQHQFTVGALFDQEAAAGEALAQRDLAAGADGLQGMHVKSLPWFNGS